MDPLTAATSVAGLLSVAIQVSKILYNQIGTVKNAPKDAKDLLDELQRLCQVLTSLEEFLKAQALKGYLFKGTSLLVSAIQGCHDKITAVKPRLEKLVRKQGFAQILERGKWYYDHDEHQELVTSLHRYLGIFQISLNVDGIELLSKSAEDVTREIKGMKAAISAFTPDLQQAQAKLKQLDDILQLLSPIPSISNDVTLISKSIGGWDVKWQDQESRDILDWLSPLNFWTKQDDTFSRKEDGTGRRIFEEPAFNAWLDGTERMLWCPGIPGAGKTILTSTVIDYLKQTIHEQEIGVAFIYCNYKEKTNQTTVNLVAGLLKQLIQTQSVIPSKLRSLYEQRIGRNTRPTLVECSELLHVELAAYSRAFIIVDALDECDETSGAQRDLTIQLLRLPPNISLMITSRDVPSIQHKLSHFCRLEIRASDADVRTYLERRIEREERLTRHVEADPALLRTVLETIVKKAKGMFLLAQLHIESLTRKHTRKAVREALEKLPQGLDETYDEVMERIHSQEDDDVQLAMNVLTWVSYSLKPLTVKELQDALAVEPSSKAIDEEALLDETIMVSVCAGIITIDQESNIIRLVHYTTEEYFQRKRLDRFPTGQTDIARTCLTYLSFDAFKAGYASSDEQMDARLEEYPLLQYAAQYWGVHAVSGAEHDVQSQVLEFLTLDANLSCSVQAMRLPSYYFKGYSQSSAREIPGLWVAAVFGLIKTVRVLLSQNDNLDITTTWGETALHGAASSGRDAVVRLLVEKGAAVDATDEDGWTALHEAVVRLLVEKGAAVDAASNYGRTALHWAASRGHEAVVRLLVRKGAAVDAANTYGKTALHGAAWSGHEAVVRLLVEKGAAVDATDEDGWTALHKAASSGHEAVVRLLVEKGAAVDAASDYGWTALYRAALSGHEAVVRLLVEKGAAVDATSNCGPTALYWAASSGHEAVVRWLVEKGAAVDATDEDGCTALHRAASSGHKAVVRLLVERGAAVDATDEDGWTALHRAAWSGHEAVVRLLVEGGAVVDTADTIGGMALHWAAWSGHEAVMRLLVDKGAAVDAAGTNGWTALHWAAWSGHEAVVRLLVEKGAAVDATDETVVKLLEAHNIAQ